MSIQVHETRTYEGKQYTAVTQSGCDNCMFDKRNLWTACVVRHLMPCGMSAREDRRSIIWLKADDAAKALVLGRMP